MFSIRKGLRINREGLVKKTLLAFIRHLFYNNLFIIIYFIRQQVCQSYVPLRKFRKNLSDLFLKICQTNAEASAQNVWHRLLCWDWSNLEDRTPGNQFCHEAVRKLLQVLVMTLHALLEVFFKSLEKRHYKLISYVLNTCMSNGRNNETM